MFLPDYECAKTQDPQNINSDDSGWHVMNVPDLWSPYSAWLFGERFSGIPGDKGASESFMNGWRFAYMLVTVFSLMGLALAIMTKPKAGEQAE